MILHCEIKKINRKSKNQDFTEDQLKVLINKYNIKQT